MMKKDNDSIGIIANHFSAILFGDPSRIIIYPPQGKSRGSVVIRERQYEISLLRVTIKDQGKRYEYTEKNLPYIIIFQRGSFLESSDSFLIVGKNWTLLWGSVLQNVELDLMIFATGNEIKTDQEFLPYELTFQLYQRETNVNFLMALLQLAVILGSSWIGDGESEPAHLLILWKNRHGVNIKVRWNKATRKMK